MNRWMRHKGRYVALGLGILAVFMVTHKSLTGTSAKKSSIIAQKAPIEAQYEKPAPPPLPVPNAKETAKIEASAAEVPKVYNHAKERGIVKHAANVAQYLGVSESFILANLHKESRGGLGAKNDVAQILDDTFLEQLAKYGKEDQREISRRAPQAGRIFAAVLPFVSYESGLPKFDEEGYQKFRKRNPRLKLSPSIRTELLKLRENSYLSILCSARRLVDGKEKLQETADRFLPRNEDTSVLIARVAYHFGPNNGDEVLKGAHRTPKAPMSKFKKSALLKKMGISPNMPVRNFLGSLHEEMKILRKEYQSCARADKGSFGHPRKAFPRKDMS